MKFIGTYKPTEIFSDSDWKLELYMRTDGKLYFPSTSHVVKTSRAYFKLCGDLYADAEGIQRRSTR